MSARGTRGRSGKSPARPCCCRGDPLTQPLVLSASPFSIPRPAFLLLLYALPART